jgi:hypothetical protein
MGPRTPPAACPSLAVASTFFKSLDVPWPHSFSNSMSRVSVINLNLLELPKAGCMHPGLSFYVQFNGASELGSRRMWLCCLRGAFIG